MKHVTLGMLWLLLLLLLPQSGQAEDIIYHKIRKGDTVWSISKKYGVPTWHLLVANNIRDNRIRAGEILSITYNVSCRLYETGGASWYGPGFHGKTTKDGTKYDQNGISAALNEKFLNKWVLVTLNDNEIGPGSIVNSRELKGKQFVPVPITDTGSFRKKYEDRVIDLSKGAMHELGGDNALVAGVVPVKVFVCE